MASSCSTCSSSSGGNFYRSETSPWWLRCTGRGSNRKASTRTPQSAHFGHRQTHLIKKQIPISNNEMVRGLYAHAVQGSTLPKLLCGFTPLHPLSTYSLVGLWRPLTSMVTTTLENHHLQSIHGSIQDQSIHGLTDLQEQPTKWCHPSYKWVLGC